MSASVRVVYTACAYVPLAPACIPSILSSISYALAVTFTVLSPRHTHTLPFPLARTGALTWGCRSGAGAHHSRCDVGALSCCRNTPSSTCGAAQEDASRAVHAVVTKPETVDMALASLRILSRIVRWDMSVRDAVQAEVELSWSGRYGPARCRWMCVREVGAHSRLDGRVHRCCGRCVD